MVDPAKSSEEASGPHVSAATLAVWAGEGAWSSFAARRSYSLLRRRSVVAVFVSMEADASADAPKAAAFEFKEATLPYV